MRNLILLILLLANTALADSHCKHSEWGPEDQVGAANRISTDTVLKAAQLIKKGNTYSLGLIIDGNTPAYPPRSLALTIVQPLQQEGARPSSDITYNDDIFNGWLGIGSQIDGLGHLGTNGEYYNCNHAKDFAQITGLTKLGIENVPPIVARGILLDMAGHFGVPHLEAGQHFSADDVKAVAKKQGTPIQEGDVVLLHTGWADAKLESDPAAWGGNSPGQSAGAAKYLASKKVIAVGADTWGLDVVPSEVADKPFPGHVIYLKENGIYVLEGMNTGPLVKDEVFEFLFVLGQAKVRGAVQMIINPIAIN